MTYLDYLEQKVLLERLVIGLEEPVLIKGLGELSAKIDSGNGGYNVIHGTDFHQQGDELMFTTHDSFGHEKKIQAKVIDTIEVNMGGGNIESRPVIELDIKFAGEDYKKIPFSVSDRSTNSNPILISKGFVENELEALIDVGAMNISHEGRDVVYGEGFVKKIMQKTPTVAKAIGNAGKSFGKGVQGALKTLGKGIANADTWMNGGDDVDLFAPLKGAVSIGKDLASGVKDALSELGGSAVLKSITNMAHKIVFTDDLIKKDKEKIQSQLSNTAIPQILSKAKDADLDGTIIPNWNKINLANLPIIQVTSFMCNKGKDKNDVISGLEQKKKQWKKAIKQAKRVTSEIKRGASSENGQKSQNSDIEQKEEQEEVLFEYFDILENSLILEEVQEQIENDSQEQNDLDTTPDLSIDEIQEVQTSFDSLNLFSLWFIPISLSSSGDVIKNLKTKIDSEQKKYNELLQNKNISLEQKKETAYNINKLKKQYNKAQLSLDSKSSNRINEIIQKSDSILIKLFNQGLITSESAKPVVDKLASIIQNKGGQGFFIIALGDDENEARHYDFFESLSSIAYSKKVENKDEQPQEENKEDPDSRWDSWTSDVESEEEPWIEDKLNHFRQQGII